MVRKLIPLFLLISILFLSACSGEDRMYDSKFADAKEFAEYWCGPCELSRQYKVQTYTDEVTVNEMTDMEYGFKYNVEENHKEYSNNKDYVSYYCHDFEYYYLQEFMKQVDLTPVTGKYGLTTEVKELETPKFEGIYPLYSPDITFTTDRSLTMYESREIIDYVKAELAKFDTRHHYTKDRYSNYVMIYVRSAPTDEEKAVGAWCHSENGGFGYGYQG